jgi:hypothetical protein
VRNRCCNARCAAWGESCVGYRRPNGVACACVGDKGVPRFDEEQFRDPISSSAGYARYAISSSQKRKQHSDLHFRTHAASRVLYSGLCVGHSRVPKTSRVRMVTHSESALVRRDLLANVSRDRFHRAREYKPHLRDGSMGQSHTAAINRMHTGDGIQALRAKGQLSGSASVRARLRARGVSKGREAKRSERKGGVLTIDANSGAGLTSSTSQTSKPWQPR